MKSILVLLLSAALMACGSAEQSTENTDNTQEVSQSVEVKPINATDFQSKLNDSTVVVIDVRTPGEVSNGYITGADHFIDINSPEFEQRIKELDKSKTYLMYCRSGGRSGRAAKFMVNNGFTDVYNLSGGIMNYTGEVTQ